MHKTYGYNQMLVKDVSKGSAQLRESGQQLKQLLRQAFASASVPPRKQTGREEGGLTDNIYITVY